MVLALALTLVGYAALLGPVFWYLPLETALVVCAGLLGVVAVLATQADRVAYVVTKAVAIDRDEYPELFDRVDRLAAQADVPRPPVAVIPSDEPNALSAGTGRRTVVCVTTGLLRELDDDELEAVLAHELAHIENGDSAVMAVAGFPTTVAVALLGFALRRLNGWWLLFGFFQVFVYVLFVAVPLLVVSLPGTLVLSRYREYAADRGAVALTGDPYALASALGKLHGDPDGERPEQDLRRMAGFSAFCIVPTEYAPIRLPSTHPPTHRRIERLRELAADLERTRPPE